MFTILFALVQVGVCFAFTGELWTRSEEYNPYVNPIMAWIYSDVRCQPYYLEHTDRYFCTDDGVFTCVNGWTGDNCDEPVCMNGCSGNGKCVAPDICRCDMGYQGGTCQSCIKHPGCVHGSCITAFQCNCEDGWEGRDCNIPKCSEGCDPDFGFCDTPDTCFCKHGSGVQGPNCTECMTKEGCKHGTCINPGECNCNGTFWSGHLCDEPVCLDGCSMEHGYCTEPQTCICKTGWQGTNCDECAPYPGCNIANTIADGACEKPWECLCIEGFAGETCEDLASTPIAIMIGDDGTVTLKT